VNQFDMMGVPVVNMAYAIGRSRDKLRRPAVPLPPRHRHPKTVMVRNPGQMAAAQRLVGGPPVVLKLIRAHRASG